LERSTDAEPSEFPTSAEERAADLVDFAATYLNEKLLRSVCEKNVPACIAGQLHWE
jgi:hypothetical protein